MTQRHRRASRAPNAKSDKPNEVLSEINNRVAVGTVFQRNRLHLLAPANKRSVLSDERVDGVVDRHG